MKYKEMIIYKKGVTKKTKSWNKIRSTLSKPVKHNWKIDDKGEIVCEKA